MRWRMLEIGRNCVCDEEWIDENCDNFSDISPSQTRSPDDNAEDAVLSNLMNVLRCLPSAIRPQFIIQRWKLWISLFIKENIEKISDNKVKLDQKNLLSLSCISKSNHRGFFVGIETPSVLFGLPSRNVWQNICENVYIKSFHQLPPSSIALLMILKYRVFNKLIFSMFKNFPPRRSFSLII